MLIQGYNYPILKKYEKIIHTLMSYCYKQKFPVIKDYDFILWVLKVVNGFYLERGINKILKLKNVYRLGIIDESDKNKFKARP